MGKVLLGNLFPLDRERGLDEQGEADRQVDFIENLPLIQLYNLSF